MNNKEAGRKRPASLELKINIILFETQNQTLLT